MTHQTSNQRHPISKGDSDRKPSPSIHRTGFAKSNKHLVCCSYITIVIEVIFPTDGGSYHSYYPVITPTAPPSYHASLVKAAPLLGENGIVAACKLLMREPNAINNFHLGLVYYWVYHVMALFIVLKSSERVH